MKPLRNSVRGMAVAFFLVLSAADAHGANREILFDATIQEHSNWCWAASSAAVLDNAYYTSVSQCTIANYAWNRSDCCGNSTYDWSHACNQVNDVSAIQRILSHWSVASTAYSWAISQSACVSEINAGRPFVFRWAWDGGGGHFLVGYGYEGDGNYLWYMNPLPGHGDTLALYTWVQKATGDHTWSHSVAMATQSTANDRQAALTMVLANNILM